jgi:multidrug efflux system membrane fusion protein
MIRSLITSLVLAAAVVGWIMSGQFGETPEADAANSASEVATPVAEPILVRTKSYAAQDRIREIILRGRTEAKRWVDVKAETGGKIVAVLVSKGETVRQGQIIARIAMDDREARLAEAIARVNQRQIEYNAAEQLNERGFKAKTKFAESAADLDRAISAQVKIELEIANTEIFAPFDGRIEDRAAEIGDVVATGSIIARVIDQDPYLVVGHISERDVHRLRIGDSARAELITEEIIEGKVSFIAETANPATRTFRVEVLVRNPDRKLRDGLTAEIRIPVENQPAHLLSPSVLTLNDDGELGIRTVTDDNIVRFIPIEIIGDGNDGVWLSGLPDPARVIIVGQDFVRHGDPVRIDEDESPES